MRFDPLYLNHAIAALDQTSALQQQLTNELSSGKRVNVPGDDPVAVGQNVLLSAQLQMNDSFSQTESSLVGRMQVTDSTLGSVVSQLTQAVSLATQGNNGTLNASDLKSIANELAGIRDEIVSLANTTYMGTYLFSGSQGNTAPFSLDTSVSPNTVSYNGDSVISYVVTPDGQQIQVNLPGNTIFNDSANDVLGILNNLIAEFSSGSSSAASQADATALGNALNYVSQQRVVLDNSITRLQAAQSYTQTQAAQMTAVQTDLMQTDMAQVSTQLSTAETQQSALIQVVNLLEKNNGDLFSLL
ncbi:flagellar hook-associated protein FlgL [Pseudacidobacterium ailaaui]|uniref:flagellar hook-associated protein FlgL n=1 Tax=Pseudacidobacterium ailaaui TaxID=1382359 RepID=UPI0004788148|nr:flagellar hook-associated protein FlgL [Pseudacidobacterium ailaaui]